MTDDPSYQAKVVTLNKKRTGLCGELTQVQVRILQGEDKDRVVRRNVMGPVQIGDMLMLRASTRLFYTRMGS